MKTWEAAIHRGQLYRLLTALADEAALSPHIAFKGGTCATMLGYLDRFSVDLDFDFLGTINKDKARDILHKMFDTLDLECKDESRKALQFFLKYEAPEQQRSTIKLEILDKRFTHNQYEVKYFSDIDRYLRCQTLDTMFTHKLVALTARYEDTGNIAGRDLYDIVHFLKKGYPWNEALIQERTQMAPPAYLKKLHAFIRDKVTQQMVDQDLNTLLPAKRFRKLRLTLKQDALVFLQAAL